jgi:pimeloyl-ACP methyl ester carboxylesterase
MTEYMISLRNADGSSGVGPARYLAFTDPATPPRELDPKRWLAEIIASFAAAAPSPSGRPGRTGDVLFFVHGFNVSAEAAMKGHLDTVASLNQAGWVGRVVGYDWPSDGLVFAYLPDRENARGAASGLVSSGISLLEAAQQTDCTINVHVMAHSMGCFVVQQAFTWAYQDVPADWSVAQLMLVAADVDATVFSAGAVSAQMFVQHAGRLTAYCNRYDKALAVSDVKRLDLAPRMGRIGLPSDAPAMMCEVDCSALFNADYPDPGQQIDPQLTHCFYFSRPEFWRDVVLTLAGGLDRNLFPTRTVDASGLDNRFDLDPAGISDAAYKLALARAATTPSTPVA